MTSGDLISGDTSLCFTRNQHVSLRLHCSTQHTVAYRVKRLRQHLTK